MKNFFLRFSEKISRHFFLRMLCKYKISKKRYAMTGSAKATQVPQYQGPNWIGGYLWEFFGIQHFLHRINF